MSARWPVVRHILTVALSMQLILLCSCASLLKPTLKQKLIEIKSGEYLLDPKHSSVIFKIDHMGLSKFVGRFNQVQASLQFNPQSIETSQLEAVVDMRSVDVNDDKFEDALRGRFWFNTDKYPQAYFKTLSAKKINDKQIAFNGLLLFLGQQKTITLNVHVNGAGNNLLTGKYTLGFAATTEFLRSDFGLDRYIPTVGDKIELEIHAEFQKQ